MTSGGRIIVAATLGGGIAALGYLIWKKFRPRGIPTAEQWDVFASAGDVNRDGYIDSIDLAIIKAAFGSTPSDANWNPACDFDGNSRIDILDVEVIVQSYGKNIWDFFGL